LICCGGDFLDLRQRMLQLFLQAPGEQTVIGVTGGREMAEHPWKNQPNIQKQE
jgi:hypothetical protein